MKKKSTSSHASTSHGDGNAAKPQVPPPAKAKVTKKSSPPSDFDRPGFKLALAETERVFNYPPGRAAVDRLCADGEEHAKDVILMCKGRHICGFVPWISKRGTLLRLLQHGFTVTGTSPLQDVLHVEIRFDTETSALEALDKLAQFPLRPTVRTQVPQP